MSDRLSLFVVTKAMIYEMARELAQRYPCDGFDVGDVAPNDFESLKALSRVIVWSGASEGTIYPTSALNWAFRAHHDAIHLRTRLGFAYECEKEVTRIGIRELGLHTCPLLADLYWADGIGQQSYYYTNGEFPPDQLAFVFDELNKQQQIRRFYV